MTNGYRECDCEIDIKQLERKNAALVAANERLREALEGALNAFDTDEAYQILLAALTAAGTEEK